MSLHRCRELLQELVVDAGVHDHALRVDAGLAIVDGSRLDSLADRGIKIRRRLHDDRVRPAKRKNDLEDAALDLMEKLEGADAAVAEQEALIAATNAEGAELSAEGKRVVAEATAESEQASRDRAAIAGGLPAALVALYDKIATRSAGAGLLRRGACEGCNMVLPGTELQAVREASDDAVLMCPECGCILVRTDESGL